MKLSNNGLNLIKRFEGYRSNAYRCAAGVATIGWGTTSINGKPVTMGMTCTETQATEWLKADVVKFENRVNKYDSKYHWTQNEFDALVSFAYNLGSIDGLTSNGTRTREQISEKFLAYSKAGGKTNQGLLSRRRVERALFDSDPGKNTIGNVAVPTIKKGTKGSNALLLQKNINKVTNAQLVEDGIFGSKSCAALYCWQEANGLVPDKIYGSKSYAVMKKQIEG